MVILVAGSIAIYFAATDKCSYDTIDLLPSPAGNLAIARVWRFCTYDDGAEPVMFALLRSGEHVKKRNVFLSTNQYEGLRWNPLSVFAKWDDNDSLLVAAPEGAVVKDAPIEVSGIHVQYRVYPTDSGTTKIGPSAHEIIKYVDFETKYEMPRGLGLPGPWCSLEVSANDGEFIDRLSLSITARVTLGTGGWNKGKFVYNRAYSTYDFQIVGRDEVEKPGKHATGADVLGFSTGSGRSTLWGYEVNKTGSRAPSGVPMPKWDFAYAPKDPQDLVAMANMIKEGSLAIRVGYWLDDYVVVYSARGPIDKQPIDEFERCVAENHILETPRLGERRFGQGP